MINLLTTLPSRIAAVSLTIFANALLAQTPPPSYVVTTIAGTTAIGDGGLALSALLSEPRALKADAAGNLYFADRYNNRIREITPDGIITTIFGTGAPVATDPAAGPGQAAIHEPTSIAFDQAGALYIGHLAEIVKVSNGTVTVVAGGGTSTAEGVPATTALIVGHVFDMTFDSAGYLYFSDGNSPRIRKIGPDGIITTVAGALQSGTGGDGGPATAAQLANPRGLAFDSAGALYISESGRIRKVTPDGIIRTVPGTGTSLLGANSFPYSLAFDPNGVLYFTDYGTNLIEKITPDGVVHPVAGPQQGFAGDGGPALQASINYPESLAFDTAGNLIFTDSGNDRIRKLSPFGIISTVAGAVHFSGDNGPATLATSYSPVNPAVDSRGNIYFADYGNNRIRKIDPSGVITTVAGNGVAGYTGDNGPATSATLNSPNGVAIDAVGNLYIADYYNSAVRKVNPAGVITTFAGNFYAMAFGDGGLATAAGLYRAADVAVDLAGNVFISDDSDNTIRKVTPDGKISTLVGKHNSTGGFSGDNGPASAAALNSPQGLATDAQGNLYIADTGNGRLRKVTPAGFITTIAGTGTPGMGGDGGPAALAQLPDPIGITLDSLGNIYITDDVANSVRRISTAGIIDLIAGGTGGYSGDGGPALNAAFYSPIGIAVDPQNNLIVADTYNNVVRKLTSVPAPQK